MRHCWTAQRTHYSDFPIHVQSATSAPNDMERQNQKPIGRSVAKVPELLAVCAGVRACKQSKKPKAKYDPILKVVRTNITKRFPTRCHI